MKLIPMTPNESQCATLIEMASFHFPEYRFKMFPGAVTNGLFIYQKGEGMPPLCIFNWYEFCMTKLVPKIMGKSPEMQKSELMDLLNFPPEALIDRLYVSHCILK